MVLGLKYHSRKVIYRKLEKESRLIELISLQNNNMKSCMEMKYLRYLKAAECCVGPNPSVRGAFDTNRNKSIGQHNKTRF